MKDWKQVWLSSPFVSDNDKAIIEKLSLLKKEKKLFQKSFKIINNSIRLPIGLGSNAFNIYNFQFLAQALLATFLQKPILTKVFPLIKIIICHDNREKSQEISQGMADVFLAANLEVFFFSNNQPVPTPFLSYLLKKNQGKYQLGIMITASHNNAKINGCKFMYGDGTTFSYQECQNINTYLHKNYQTFFAHHHNFISDKSSQKLAFANKDEYLYRLASSFKLSLFFQNQFLANNSRPAPQLRIYYSALNGMGQGWTDQLLKKQGFSLTLIPKHCQNQKENCQFKNVYKNTPNPELTENFAEPLRFLNINNNNSKYDLIIINDGDADRVGVACLATDQSWKIFSGNEIAIIFTHFFLFYQKQQGKIYHSRVSSFLINNISQKMQGIETETTNTGFNYLAEKYQKNATALFAFEESMGFLLDFTINGDKDGLQGALFLANIAQYLAYWQKINLTQYLDRIYQKFGKFWTLSLKIKKNRWFQNQIPFASTLYSASFETEKGEKIYCFHRWSQTESLIWKNYFYGSGAKTQQKLSAIDKHLKINSKEFLDLHHLHFQNLEKKN